MQPFGTTDSGDRPRPQAPASIIPTIAIIGGGLSGAAVAFHLARNNTAARIVVIEPRAELGRGLAYSATDPVHRLNVPATKMTIRTDRPSDFADWLTTAAAPELTPDAVAANGDIFTPRAVFGQYAAARLAPDLALGRITHLRQVATKVVSKAGRSGIELGDGTSLTADIIVLALTHPKPTLLRALQPLAGTDGLIADPLAPGAMDQVAVNDRVIIIGSGLTSADITATLRRRGFAGNVQVISRHGWRSMPHAPKQAATSADFATNPEATALGLLRRVRRAVARDAAGGLTWHAAFDQLRLQGPAIWAALPEAERRCFLRHLRSLWDVHRFRIAPQTAAAASALQSGGQITYRAGQIQTVTSGAAGMELTLKPRHKTEVVTLHADKVIMATGPDHAGVINSNPVLHSLWRAGLILPDPLRLGIATAADGSAVSSAGHPGRIFVAGPLARGTVGELMGLPEVISWSEHVARSVTAAVAQIASDPPPK